jgi:hypothetical protein
VSRSSTPRDPASRHCHAAENRIFYDITRKLTVRAQTGEASAVDLVYTIKFD